MRYIKIAATDSGAHENQFGGGHPGEGWAAIPDEMALPASFPFVSLTVSDGVVTEMTASEVPEPEPVVPQPTAFEQLRADVDFILAMEGYI